MGPHLRPRSGDGVQELVQAELLRRLPLLCARRPTTPTPAMLGLLDKLGCASPSCIGGKGLETTFHSAQHRSALSSCPTRTHTDNIIVSHMI